MTKSSDSRSYGAGTTGTTSSAPRKVTLRNRLRYRFDASIMKSPLAFLRWVLIFAFLTTIVVTLAMWPLGQLSSGSGFMKIFTGWWTTMNYILFGSNGPGGATYQQAAVYGLAFIPSITITATIIGLAATMMNRFFDRLAEGRSPVIESGHTLILGWSNRVFPILQQLAVANENVKKPLVVIVAERPVAEMQAEITDRAGDLGATRVLFRNADPSNPNSLTSANITGARSVLILDESDLSDATVISTVLSAIAANPHGTSPIVAEVDTAEMQLALDQVSRGRVRAVVSSDVIAQVTAQVSRMPGLASVVLDFMDFEGDEIYFTNVPALIGVTYGDALLGFSKSSLIGIRRANGKVELNPSHDTVFGEGDQVIAVSEDDDTVVYTRATQPTVAPARVDREPDTSVSLLVIGWSDMGEKVITALTPFLAHNSELTVVAEESFVASPPQASYHGVPVTYRTIDGSLATLESIAKEKHFDEIIVLAYRHGISSDDADGKTMLSMLLLNHLFDVHDNGIERTRLVAEILDSRRRDLARIAHADDLVVSDNLSALMMCQISENPDLTAVYDDLFDADGAQLLVLPIENYVTPGVTVSFAELVAAASLRGESAVGYRSASHDEGDPAAGVHVNPAKSQLFTPNTGDGLVVIGSV